MSKKARILIVDDDPISCETLEGLLFPEGYETTVASCGQEAITLVKTFNPDTILLDVIMSDMDGFEVCQQIKADEKTRQIPIILVTGLESKEDLSKGLNAGAEDFLKKPVNGIELRARVRSMLRIKRQFDELEETMLLREDLSNMVVHDMKNPLSAVMLASQLLQMNIKTPSELKFVDTIYNQSRRLESIMNDMLTLAKMKEGKLILNRKNININNLVQELGKGYNMIAQAKRMEFVMDLPENAPEVSIDDNLFQRVLDNLISNAMKFSPNDSKIILQVERLQEPNEAEPPTVRIKVIDEGYGIPEDHRDDVFDKYKVVDLRRKGIPQFGLGLAFCKMVVEAHGGHIFVASNTPNGSIFTIEL
ncbi:MAG: hybrid sensor histidine kinase/response regulator [Candidatus Anammoxibacter sp.]